MTWAGWLLAVLGAATLVGAAVLAAHAKRNSATWFAILAFAGFGSLQILSLVRMSLPDAAWPGVLFTAVWIIVSSAIIAFVIAYPGYALTRYRTWASWWTLALGASLAASFLLAPPLLSDDAWQPRELIAILIVDVGDLLAPLILGSAWLRAADGPARHALRWALAPFLFWSVHDSLPTALLTRGDAVAMVRVGFALVGLLAVLALTIVSIARLLRHRAATEERRFVLLVAAIFLASLVQFVPALPQAHLLLDSVAVLLLLYAVARHRILDVDLKLRWTVRQSTVAGAFVAVFFVASEGAAAFFGERTGSTMLGIGAAALLVFAISPLQRAAEKLSERAVPVRGSTEAYLTYRRMELYRVALEGMLRDDVLAPREAQALQGLRGELGISLEEHDLIENELRARLRREVAA